MSGRSDLVTGERGLRRVSESEVREQSALRIFAKWTGQIDKTGIYSGFETSWQLMIG